MRPWPGNAYPLGASYDGAGTNFALFSEIAEKVEVCLFAARAALQPRQAAARPVRQGYRG
jgi:pullulanase/glycogen debranching enzyme